MFFITKVIILVSFSCVNKEKSSNHTKVDMGVQRNMQTFNLPSCDTTLLNRRAINLLYDFKPSKIDLGDCMSDSLVAFLKSVDSSCLRSLQSYKKLVCGLLLKLYAHHVECCIQGYDLLSMKSGEAKIIIEEYEWITNVYNEKRDMLNSASVFYFVKEDSLLSKDPLINKIMQQIRGSKYFIE
jgi:hypothetical protein